MSTILLDIEDQALVEAIEASFVEEMAAFGRGLPGAELHEDPELAWILTGRPHLNAVLHTHFARDDRDYVDARIDETLAYFSTRSVSTITWSVGPSSRPADLATRLEENGFVYAIDSIGMALDLNTLPIDSISQDAIPGFAIKEATDAESLKPVYTLQMEGFGASEEIAQIYYDTYLNIGFGEKTPWRHFIGELDGKPVAITSLLLYAGVAGIYGVATAPEVRRRGIGTAMTRHALNVARALGYRIAVLSPSEMSMGIYERLGFRERCCISHYGKIVDE